MTGVAIALGGLTIIPEAWGAAQQMAMKDVPITPANKSRTSLHYQVDFKPAPQRIYDALLDPKQFAAFSGLPAEIDPQAGGAFSLFSGHITGRNVELVPGVRIVQAWRPGSWAPGVYSIVKFEMKARGAESTVILDHTGFPEGDADGLNSGWHEHYLNPLQKFFA